MDKSRQQEIADAWNRFNEDDVSTERLLAMVGDTCNAEVTEIIEALVAEGILRNADA